MQILRLKRVIELTGLGRTSIYNRVKNGTFPKQISLGGRAVGWLAAEVEAWVLANIHRRDAVAACGVSQRAMTSKVTPLWKLYAGTACGHRVGHVRPPFMYQYSCALPAKAASRISVN